MFRSLSVRSLALLGGAMSGSPRQAGPGAVIELPETWDLVSGVGSSVHQYQIDKVVLSKVSPR